MRGFGTHVGVVSGLRNGLKLSGNVLDANLDFTASCNDSTSCDVMPTALMSDVVKKVR